MANFAAGNPIQVAVTGLAPPALKASDTARIDQAIAFAAELDGGQVGADKITFSGGGSVDSAILADRAALDQETNARQAAITSTQENIDNEAQSREQALAGLAQPLSPTFVLDDNLIGSYRVVADLAARNAIPLDHRKAGMRVKVMADDSAGTSGRVFEYNSDGSWTGLKTDAENAAVDAKIQPVLPVFTNFKLDPALPLPTDAFTGATIVTHPTSQVDNTLTTWGYFAGVLNTDNPYQRIALPRTVVPGEWITIARLVAVDNSSRWASLDGRFATRLLTTPSQSYGDAASREKIWDIISTENYIAIDATHRIVLQYIQVTDGQPVNGLICSINTNGIGASVAAGGWAVGVSSSKPVGLEMADNDPLGVQAVGAQIAGVSAATAEVAESVADLSDKIDGIASPQSVIPFFTNFKLDPSLPLPVGAFDGATIITHPVTDAVLSARGYLAQSVTADDVYQRIVLPRIVQPGEWIVMSRLVAVGDAATWDKINGRVATRLLTTATQSYGDAASREFIWNVVTADAYDAIDETHRVLREYIQVTDGKPVAAVINSINTGGITVSIIAGGWAVGASSIKSNGLSLDDNDPFSVQKVRKTLATGSAPSFRLRGDSLTDGTGSTSGNTVTDRIGYYLGGAISRLGVPGSTSQSAVDRACGVAVSLSGDKLSAGGSTVITGFHGYTTIHSTNDGANDANGNPLWWYQPLTTPARADTASQPFSILGVRGTLTRTATSDLSSESYTFTYPALPADITGLNGGTVVATPAESDLDIDAIWTGTNDRYATAIVVANISAYLSGGDGAKRFAMGPLNATTEYASQGGNHNSVRAINNALAGKYRYYIDIQSELVRWGLVAAGLTPTSDDLTAMTNGVSSVQLHASGDSVHLNDAGYDAVAQIAVCYMLRWGWVTTITLAHVPALWPSWSA